MAWAVKVTDEYAAWFTALIKQDLDSATQVAQAVAALREEGPTLGRPLVDRLKATKIHHLKELRPGSKGRSEIRIIFAFDPTRSALLLLGGDKAGNWARWYRDNIPLAERLYIDYTADGSAVNSHAHLQARMVLERAADLQRAVRRRFGTGIKDQSHSITSRDLEQAARGFGALKLVGDADDLV